MSLLEVNHLKIAFRRPHGLMGYRLLESVRDISLRVDRGETLALFGASGAGKSLFAHALLGLLPENAVLGGAMCFDGAALDHDAQARLRGKRMALVPQSISYLDPLASVGQQLGWAAERAGRMHNPQQEILDNLQRFGLSANILDAFPHSLSGGMARRVMLAITAVSKADLIVADEPTGGLDADNARVVMRFLKEFADMGKAVIVISHDLPAALEIADRVTILRDGSVAAHERATDFSGDGAALGSSYARSLWNALPQNGFGRLAS